MLTNLLTWRWPWKSGKPFRKNIRTTHGSSDSKGEALLSDISLLRARLKGSSDAADLPADFPGRNWGPLKKSELASLSLEDSFLKRSSFQEARGMARFLRFLIGGRDRMAISHDGNSMRKKRPKRIKNNLVCLTVAQHNMNPTRTNILTCNCGGQLFTLCNNGDVLCHGCRTKHPDARFRIV